MGFYSLVCKETSWGELLAFLRHTVLEISGNDFYTSPQACPDGSCQPVLCYSPPRQLTAGTSSLFLASLGQHIGDAWSTKLRGRLASKLPMMRVRVWFSGSGLQLLQSLMMVLWGNHYPAGGYEVWA